MFFFFNDTATTEIYTLSLHDALPICGWAEVSVSDEGVGISPDFLPYVFEPFRQGADGSLNKQGLGLGLAITREIVEGHGGGIHAVSGGEGAGATFTVRLRRTDEVSTV